MNKLILELTVRRVIHLVFGCVVISSLIALLCVTGILPDGSGKLLAGMCAGVILYIVFNVKMMRRTFFLVRKKSFYCVVNFGAYFVFGFVNILVYKFCSGYIFAWLFAITKFLRYTNLSLNIPASVCVFHLILVIAALCAPIGMEWMYEHDEMNAVEIMPGILEVNPLEKKTDKEVEINEIQKETETNTLSEL